MGYPSPLVRRHKLIIKFWNRLIGMSQFRLTRKIFYWNYALGDNNWATDIKALFTNIGMENVFSNKVVCNLTTAENVLYVKMCNSWEEEIYQKPKLRTYVTFKSTFGPEPYVYSYMSRSERSLLAQLRIAVLPLKIETGRYNNIKVEDSICNLCDLDIVKTKITLFVLAQYMLIFEKEYSQSIQKLITVMIILFFG